MSGISRYTHKKLIYPFEYLGRNKNCPPAPTRGSSEHGKGKNKKGKLPGLKMAAQNSFYFPGKSYPLPKCLPAVLTSFDPLPQARKREHSNPGSVHALGLRHFRWCSSHFVSRERIPRAGEVQFPLVTNSSVLPSRSRRCLRALTKGGAVPPQSAVTAVASTRS